ncbi:MAG: hypothetical protein V4722_22485 [Bacteroidota bacterium]
MPKPAPKASPASNTSNTFKNIIIGIVTTVAASAIVYWLGFAGNKSDEKQLKKDATYKALETLDKYEHMYFATVDDIECRRITGNGNVLRQEDGTMMINQLTNTIATLTDVKNEPNIDIDMKAILQRRITYYTSIKSEYSKMLERLVALPPGSSQQAEINNISNTFQNALAELSLTEQQPIFDLYSSIEKKYNQEITGTKRQLEINAENLTGQWKIGGTSSMDLHKSGVLISKVENDVFKGSWQLINDSTVQLHFTEGGDNDLIIKQITKKTLYYKIAGESTYSQACRN